ncbi:MAG: glycoside hydrolase family 127 protein, partial [Victivallales bacterium]|nr:glycoside hydrolase family 127 protein [Victivallales bacterium]
MIFKNKFNILPSGAIKLQGEMGKALELATRNHIMKLDWKQLVDPFRTRKETVSWTCEFWGKQIRGAILAAYITRDPELTALVKATVADIISTQDAEGRITSNAVPFEKQEPNWGWDGWGRKYVLMGLTRYYQYIEADPKVLDACCRLLDNLMEVVGPGKQDVLDHGCHDGLAFSSILGAVVRVYRISGNQKYLDYAKWIASRGCSKNGNIFQAALNGAKPKDIGNAKAYELTSCYQGYAELCIECDDFPEAVEVLTKYYQQVRDREIYVSGIGGGLDLVGEYWNDSVFKQNCTDFEVTGAQGETCVTVTWLHYMERVLRLTGDAAVFDECEKSFYNGLLGAMTPDGSNFTHYNPTPLADKCRKVPACDQMMNNFWFAFGGNDCCRAQGHEGLALAPLMAVMTDAESGAPVFNLYEDM